MVSRSGEKSIKVAIDYISHDRMYGKYMKRRTKLSVHDQQDQAGVGDVVEVAPCRPMSKTKSWRLIRVLQKAAEGG